MVLNEEDSYIIYLYSFFSSLLRTRLRWTWSSMRKTRILYICIFFLQFIANQTEMDVVLNEEDSYIIYLYSFFSSLLRTRLRWMWSSMRKTRILYICIFFLQFIANQTEMDVVLNEEDSYIIYLYSFFSSLLRTRLRWTWSSMRKTHILYICILFSPVYCEPD